MFRREDDEGDACGYEFKRIFRTDHRNSLPIQNTISLRECLSENREKLRGILKAKGGNGNYVSYSGSAHAEETTNDPDRLEMDNDPKLRKTQNKAEEPYFLSSQFRGTRRSCPIWRGVEDGAGEGDSLSDLTSRSKCQLSHQYTSLVRTSLTRRVLFRTCQLTSVVLVSLGVVTLVASALSLQPLTLLATKDVSKDVSNSSPSLGIHEALESWMRSSPASAPNPAALLDIPQFFFLLNNRTLCDSLGEGQEGVYFLVLVHSAPDHFVERQAIRTTWGSVKSLRRWSFRLIFLLGQLRPRNEDWLGTQESILRESETYGDLVSGNFEDTYRNLTYKHLMGYRWALSHCPTAKFILKTDDDAFVDIFQLFDFTLRTYGPSPADVLLCNVYPEGTKPVRLSSAESREGGRKWIVTPAEYPFDSYPKYCGGLGYLVTPDVAGRLSTLAHSLSRFLWIDDVFVTGVMRELVRQEPFYLNLRYSYDLKDYQAWLDDTTPAHRLRKIPFIFVHVDRGGSYSEEMARLWRRTLRAWS